MVILKSILMMLCIFDVILTDILPKDPYVIADIALELTCSMDNYEGFISNGSLSLRKGNTILESEFYDSGRSIKTILNVGKKYGPILVFCYVNETLLDSTTIHVGEHAEAVLDLQCVSNNFTEMNCTFCSSNEFQYTWTTYNMLWATRPHGMSQRWSHCPIKGKSECDTCRHGCHWCKWLEHDANDSFRPGSTYYLVVKSHNIFSKEDNVTEQETHFERKTSEMVKLPPIGGLEATGLNATQVLIKWTLPELHHLVISSPTEYEIHVQSKWNSSTVLVQDKGELLLDGLKPATQYMITIRCHPHSSLYWSDVSYPLHFETYEAAPSAGPKFVMYKVNNLCGDNCREVELYWPVIDPVARNGEIMSYIVQKREKDKWVIIDDTISGLLQSKLIIDHNESMVRIQARTKQGTSPSTTITIPAHQYLQENIPELLIDSDGLILETSKDDRELQFNWNTHRNGELKVLILWCSGNAGMCKNDVNLVSVDYSLGYYSLAVPGNNIYYSMAVSNMNLTGSLTQEWLCLYHYNSRPIIQDVKLSKLNQNNVTLDLEICTCDVCHIQYPGRVVYYSYKLICLDTKCNDASSVNRTFIPGNSSYLEIKHLIPFTKYEVHVWAHGNTQISKPVEVKFKTKEEEPHHVLVLKVTSLNPVCLSWTPVPVDVGIAEQYEVLLQNKKDFIRRVKAAKNQTKSCIPDVPGDMYYSAQVHWKNTAGWSPWSKEVRLKTNVQAPSIVRNLQVTRISMQSALVTWQEPEYLNGPISFYMVEEIIGNISKKSNISNKELRWETKLKCAHKQVIQVKWRIYAVNERLREVLISAGANGSAKLCEDYIKGAILPIWALTLGVISITLIISCIIGIVVCISRQIRKPIQIDGLSTIAGKEYTLKWLKAEHELQTTCDIPHTTGSIAESYASDVASYSIVTFMNNHGHLSANVDRTLCEKDTPKRPTPSNTPSKDLFGSNDDSHCSSKSLRIDSSFDLPGSSDNSNNSNALAVPQIVLSEDNFSMNNSFSSQDSNILNEDSLVQYSGSNAMYDKLDRTGGWQFKEAGSSSTSASSMDNHLQTSDNDYDYNGDLLESTVMNLLESDEDQEVSDENDSLLNHNTSKHQDLWGANSQEKDVQPVQDQVMQMVL